MKLLITIISALLVAFVHAQKLHCVRYGIGLSLLCSDEATDDDLEPSDYCSNPRTRLLDIDGDTIKSLNHALLDFQGNCNFEKLISTKGKIEKIESGAFSNFPQLEWIHLSQNKIKKLTKNMFKKIDGGDMPNIKTLWLDNNQIDAIEEGAFDGLTGLEDLSLSHNKLTEIHFENFPNTLEMLVLKHNSLEKLIGGTRKHSIKVLDVSYTNVKPAQLSILEPDALNRLSIQGNNLNVVDLAPLANFTNLKSLNLSGNHLDGLQVSFFDNFPLLESLDVSNTGLKNVDLTKLVETKSQLVALYFNNNEIDKFDFSKVPSTMWEIGFHGNKFNFKCSELQTILEDLKSKEVTVVEGSNIGDNVNGISCRVI